MKRLADWATRPRALDEWAQLGVTALVLVGCPLFVLGALHPSKLLLGTTPAGGDMGAHVWAPDYLRHHLFTHGRLTGWSPDWYNGFPALTFYFPLPYVVIAVLSYVLPYGVAFKLVSVAGLLGLPLAAYAMGRLTGMRFPGPPLLAVATVPFLFDRYFTIWGGNIASTLAGEFAFSISLCLALLFIGVFARALDTGRYRALAAALLAATLLCHLLPTFFAIAGALILWLLRPRRRRLATALLVGGVGIALTAFWLVPFALRHGYSNDMGWERTTAYAKGLFPFLCNSHKADVNVNCPTFSVVHPYTVHLKVVVALAAAGVLGGLVLRRRTTLLIGGLGVTFAAAFRWMPQGALWNARMLPFWYLCLYLAAAACVAESALALGVAVGRHRPGPDGEVALPPPSLDLTPLGLTDDRTLVGAGVGRGGRTVGLRGEMGYDHLDGLVGGRGAGTEGSGDWSVEDETHGDHSRSLAAGAANPGPGDGVVGVADDAGAWGARAAGGATPLGGEAAQRWSRLDDSAQRWALEDESAQRSLVEGDSAQRWPGEGEPAERWAFGPRRLRHSSRRARRGERATGEIVANRWAAIVTPVLAMVIVLAFVGQSVPDYASITKLVLRDRSIGGADQRRNANFVSSWANWNYSGYERKDSYPEYADVVATMARVGREDGCGRAMWEYEAEEDRFGTPMALMLLPKWTNGCIGSQEGLYFESSATVPYHFLNQSELSQSGSRAMRALPYRSLDIVDGIAHLQLLGVRYYMAVSPAAQTAAQSLTGGAHPVLKLVAKTQSHQVDYTNGGTSAYQARTWEVYQVAASDPVVALSYEPVVMTGVPTTGKGWLAASEGWYQDRSRWDVPLAASGPPEWRRVKGADPAPPRTPVRSAVVSSIKMTDDRISFDVDTPGTPVLVRTSYFPNWQPSGARGPWRVTPNLMVVVPTSRHVELHYGYTPVDNAGLLLSGAGVIGAALLWRRDRRPRAERQWPDNDRGSGGDPGPAADPERAADPGPAADPERAADPGSGDPGSGERDPIGAPGRDGARGLAGPGPR